MFKGLFSKLFNNQKKPIYERFITEEDYWITTRKLQSSNYCDLSDDEEIFIKNLIYKFKLNKKKYYLNLERQSNKAISVYYRGYPIGKIKLQGRKTWMQIFLNLYDVKILENEELDTYIENIDLWIEYINKLKV